MKKRLLVIGALAFLGFNTSACGSSNVKNVGILQIATHDALDLAREGFIESLSENGFKEGENIKFTIQNPEGDSSKQISAAKSLVLNSDLVFGISTGSAQALKNSAMDLEKDIPVLFSAVTDPEDANLVPSKEYQNITGTSDEGDTEVNVELFTHFSFVDKIACMYNTAESNSQIQKEECKTACAKFNLQYEDAGITSATQIASSFNALVAKGVKGVFIPTDNMIAENISLLKEIAIEKKVVLVCADTTVVDNGGSLGYGVDYKELGKQTGAMAAKILSGSKKAQDIPFEKTNKFSLKINNEFFKSSGIEIPSDLNN